MIFPWNMGFFRLEFSFKPIQWSTCFKTLCSNFSGSTLGIAAGLSGRLSSGSAKMFLGAAWKTKNVYLLVPGGGRGTWENLEKLIRLVVASFFALLAWWSWTNHLWPMFSVLAQGTTCNKNGSWKMPPAVQLCWSHLFLWKHSLWRRTCKTFEHVIAGWWLHQFLLSKSWVWFSTSQ